MEKLKDFTIKHRNLLYIIAAAMVIIISCYFGFQEKNHWDSEIYGATNDGQISITNETLYKVDFEISNDDFQGIYLRFVGDTKGYTDEKILFMLVDKKSGEVVSENIMYMSEEVYISDSFVSLPWKDSKGKKAELFISGVDIKNTPQIYISKQSNLDSTLYLNGEKQKHTVMFKGVYKDTSAYNVNAFISGALCLLLLLAIYLCIYANNKNSIKTDDSSRELNNLDKIGNLVKKHRKELLFICLSIGYVLLSVFVYKFYVENIISEKQEEKYTEVKEKSLPVTIDGSVKAYSYQFKAHTDNISNIFIHVGNADVDKTSSLFVTIKDANTSQCYYENTFSGTELNELKNQLWNIEFDKVVQVSSGRWYKLEIEPVNFGSSLLELKTGFDKSNFTSKINGKVQPCSLAIDINYSNKDYYFNLYFILAILLYILFGVTYLICIRKSDIYRFFVPVTMLLGIIYMLVIPVYSVPDEYTHMDTAYILSNRILGIENTGIDSYEYKRSVDIETEQAPDYYIYDSDYRRIYTDFNNKTSDESMEKCYTKSSIANAGVLYFLPAAIGVTFARLLNLGTLPMYMLGRFMNLLAFVLLSYLAVRAIPVCKYGVLIYVSIPVVLQEAASYSYDCILNGFAVIFVAYCFKLMDVNYKIKNIDFAIFIFTLFQMALVKGGVYLPICFLALLIPVERGWKIKSIIKWFCLVTLCSLFAFAKNNMISLVGRLFSQTKYTISPFSGKEMYSFDFVFHNPGRVINVFINTFFTDGSRYIYEFFGGKMGSVYDLQLPWIYILSFFSVMSLIFISDNKTYMLKTFSKVWIAIVVIGNIFLINLSMLIADTNIKHDFIHGVQGRYFFPCIMLIFILVKCCLGLKNYKINRNKVLMINYITHVVFVLNIIMLTIVK